MHKILDLQHNWTISTKDMRWSIILTMLNSRGTSSSRRTGYGWNRPFDLKRPSNREDAMCNQTLLGWNRMGSLLSNNSPPPPRPVIVPLTKHVHWVTLFPESHLTGERFSPQGGVAAARAWFSPSLSLQSSRRLEALDALIPPALKFEKPILWWIKL